MLIYKHFFDCLRIVMCELIVRFLLRVFPWMRYRSTYTSAPCRHFVVQIYCFVLRQSNDNFQHSLTIFRLERNVSALGNIPLACNVACSCKCDAIKQNESEVENFCLLVFLHFLLGYY